MKQPYISILTRLMVAAVLLVTLPQAKAITIGFETTEGYTTTGGTYQVGSLTGQPSGTGGTAWTVSGTTNTTSETLRVVADTVTGTGQMVQSSALGSNPFYTFTPSSADLGGTFSNTSSILNFSLQFAMLGNRNAGTGTLERISFGNTTTPMFQLQLLQNGDFVFSSAGTNYYSTKSVTNATTGYVAGTTYVCTASNSWVTISGAIDYAGQTYSLSVNGVQQQVSGSTALGFNTTVLSNITSGLNLRELGGTDANYVPTAFDNISLSLAPEPSTAAMLGLALLCLCQRRRAKKLGLLGSDPID